MQADHDNPTQQYYSQVSWPYYNGYLGVVMVFDALDPPDVFGKGKMHCELAWSLNGSQYSRVAPGHDFIPHGQATAPGAPDNAFDSHICFASAHPIKLDDEVRVYYMGGDGPHYSPPYPDPLHRNSSFGLATLRPDGFVAVRAQAQKSTSESESESESESKLGLELPLNTSTVVGVGRTKPVVVSGQQLVVTADTAMAGPATSRLAVSVSSCTGTTDTANSSQHQSSSCSSKTFVCSAVLEGLNVTDFTVKGCGNLTVGSSVQLDITMQGSALFYTFGFTQ